jgi:hypothetical protein
MWQFVALQITAMTKQVIPSQGLKRAINFSMQSSDAELWIWSDRISLARKLATWLGNLFISIGISSRRL